MLFGYAVGWDATRQAVLIRPPEQLVETARPDKNGLVIRLEDSSGQRYISNEAVIEVR